MLSQFCLPDGVAEKSRESAAAHDPAFYSFALTDADGSRSFASCAMFYEPRPNKTGACATCLYVWHPQSLTEAFRKLCAQGVVHIVQVAVFLSLQRILQVCGWACAAWQAMAWLVDTYCFHTDWC